MNVICPICNQTLNASAIPLGTKVNCSRCLNDFLTPEYSKVLPVARYQTTEDPNNHTHGPLSLFGRITSFRGRINRLQYFHGLLFKFGLIFVGGLIHFLLMYLNNYEVGGLQIIIATPIFLFVIWVNLSLQTRRLHDMDQSGFLLLLYLVPFVNLIFALVIYIICLFKQGTEIQNKYGMVPTHLHAPNLQANELMEDFKNSFSWDFGKYGINRLTYNLAFILVLILSPILNMLFPVSNPGVFSDGLVYVLILMSLLVWMRIYNAGVDYDLASGIMMIFGISLCVVTNYQDKSMIIMCGTVDLFVLLICSFRKERRIPVY